MQNNPVLDMMVDAIGDRKLSRMGLLHKFRGNKHNVYGFAISLFAKGLLSKTQVKSVACQEFVYWLCRETKVVFPDTFVVEDNILSPVLMDLFLEIFDPGRDAKMILDSLYDTAANVQDWFFDNGFVTDDVIREYRYEDEMWSGRHFERCKFMLWRRGIISFGSDRWNRNINIGNLTKAEMRYYIPMLSASSGIDANKIFERSFETRFGLKHGNSPAFHNFMEYQSVPGFVGSVPGEFLIGEHRHGTDVFAALLRDGKILPENVDALRDRYDAAKSKREREIREETEKNKRADEQLYDELCRMFASKNVAVGKPKYADWNSGDRFRFAVDVDGYEHVMHIMKRGRKHKLQVIEEVTDHLEMLDKYKSLVHAKFDSLRAKGKEVTHIMEGGGAQTQAFFVSPDGYVSIMYLGMKDRALDPRKFNQIAQKSK